MAESYDKVIEGPGGLPLVGFFGLNTNQAASFRSTLGVSGAVTLGSTVTASGIIYSNNGTAITAGGAQAISFGSTSTMGIYFGSGAPTVSAATGSLYLRSDGSAATNRAYINTGGTAWTNISTAL